MKGSKGEPQDSGEVSSHYKHTWNVYKQKNIITHGCRGDIHHLGTTNLPTAHFSAVQRKGGTVDRIVSMSARAPSACAVRCAIYPHGTAQDCPLHQQVTDHAGNGVCYVLRVQQNFQICQHRSPPLPRLLEYRVHRSTGHKRPGTDRHHLCHSELSAARTRLGGSQ